MSSDISMTVIFEKDSSKSSESSKEPPMEEWASIILQQPEESIKETNYKQGLYDPGSGEICTKYIPMSASSIARSAYYLYPAIPDLGIKEALFDPEPTTIYSDDGQDLYLSLCEESGLCPISSFHQQLLENEINLRYYGVQPTAFRVIAMSLKLNTFVTCLDLTDNWIDEDGCFHLGEMLAKNCTLQVLNLCGCRIGPKGARRLFNNLSQNRALRELTLSRNQLYDEGVEHLAEVIVRGAEIRKIDLSHNKLTDVSVTHLANALEVYNKVTHLNLSWNRLKSVMAVFDLCCKLAANEEFLDLNLSWNAYGRGVATSIGILISNPNFSYLNLSRNRINTRVVNAIVKAMKDESNLRYLDLSSNPLTSEDAYNILLPMLEPGIKLQTLKLDNITVTEEFLKLRDQILELRFGEIVEITYGDVDRKIVYRNIDMRDLVLNRIDYICKTKYKRLKIDIALIVMSLYKLSQEPINTRLFIKALRHSGLFLEEELVNQLTSLFAGPVRPKSTTVNLAALIDFFKRKWPERKLPPTPPPEPEPIKKGRKKSPKKKKKKKKVAKA